jgi:putative ABC transport system permease protein
VKEFTAWTLAGYDATFVDGGPPSLQAFLPEFASPDGVWRAVLADPSLIIVDEFFLQTGGGPPEATMEVGELVTVQDPVTGDSKDLRVAALADTGVGRSPAYQGIDSVRALLGDRAVADLLFIKVAPTADANAIAAGLNGRFLANGMDASSFRQLVSDGLAQQEQFFQLMQGYLSLGLVVSVAGIGVVMVRAVRERRREVGVLRALGFESRQVRRAFLAESSFVALEGILVGAALAIVSTWRLLTSGAFGDSIAFTVPWGQVSIIIGLAFFATLAATASPARQAARIHPAVALRIAD